MKRENGYYWIIADEEDGWEVGVYADKAWFLCGKQGWFTDDELITINETRIFSPDEKI